VFAIQKLVNKIQAHFSTGLKQVGKSFDLKVGNVKDSQNLTAVLTLNAMRIQSELLAQVVSLLMPCFSLDRPMLTFQNNIALPPWPEQEAYTFDPEELESDILLEDYTFPSGNTKRIPRYKTAFDKKGREIKGKFLSDPDFYTYVSIAAKIAERDAAKAAGKQAKSIEPARKKRKVLPPPPELEISDLNTEELQGERRVNGEGEDGDGTFEFVE
jgi:hypothetical protein